MHRKLCVQRPCGLREYEGESLGTEVGRVGTWCEMRLNSVAGPKPEVLIVLSLSLEQWRPLNGV